MLDKEILQKLNEVLAMNEALMKENISQRKEIEMLKTSSNKNENVEIGCNAVMGVTLASTSGDIQVDVKYGEVITMPSEDVKILLKNNKNRKLFSECIIYFIDESNYGVFGIRKRIDISNEKIIEVVNSNDEKLILSYLEGCTSKKFELSTTNTLFYKIVIMNINKEFGIMPYEARKVIEDYFSMKIDDATKLYNNVKSLM